MHRNGESFSISSHLKCARMGFCCWKFRLEALKGKGDVNLDQRLTVKEVESYLNDAVPVLSEKLIGVAQYPNSYSRGQDFPLGVVPNPSSAQTR
jgi:hypothetical protein